MSNLSDDLFEAIRAMQYNTDGTPRGLASTPWIHLMDAVDCGSVSPMEAYDAVGLEYVPENLLTRKSRYQHLV